MRRFFVLAVSVLCLLGCQKEEDDGLAGSWWKAETVFQGQRFYLHFLKGGYVNIQGVNEESTGNPDPFAQQLTPETASYILTDDGVDFQRLTLGNGITMTAAYRHGDFSVVPGPLAVFFTFTTGQWKNGKKPENRQERVGNDLTVTITHYDFFSGGSPVTGQVVFSSSSEPK